MTLKSSRTDQAGAEYVWVPAGATLAGFWMMRTPVTNAMWRAAVEAGAVQPPQSTEADDEAGDDPAGETYDDPAKADHPVVGITRYQARWYAGWVGGRLPRDAEWTRAAQGDDGRTYPWGEQPPDDTRANFGTFLALGGDTTPVGSYPAGASPYGLLDMAGNVWEWVNSARPGSDAEVGYSEQPSMRGGPFIVRGGAFTVPGDSLRCTAQMVYVTDLAQRTIGLRVVIPAR